MDSNNVIGYEHYNKIYRLNESWITRELSDKLRFIIAAMPAFTKELPRFAKELCLYDSTRHEKDLVKDAMSFMRLYVSNISLNDEYVANERWKYFFDALEKNGYHKIRKLWLLEDVTDIKDVDNVPVECKYIYDKPFRLPFGGSFQKLTDFYNSSEHKKLCIKIGGYAEDLVRYIPCILNDGATLVCIAHEMSLLFKGEMLMNIVSNNGLWIELFAALHKMHLHFILTKWYGEDFVFPE